MLLNYLKIAARNLLKQRGLSLINILGLSIGLACFSLFLLYTIHEFSFDNFHEDGDQIYRVYRWSADMDGEGEEGDPHLPIPLGPAMQADFPDVEAAVRWKEAWGESNPTGKTIEIKLEETFESFTVSAIAEDPPNNSTKQFQIIGSFDYFLGTTYGKKRADNWGSSFLTLFVKLKEGSGLAKNASALLKFREKYYPGQEAALRESGDWTREGPPVTYRLQSLKSMHTNPNVLGASIVSIISLLTKDFIRLILIAMVIATPLAYYFMQSWLQDFAYRIHISWWVFVLAGAIAILIAFLTVGLQSLKAALTNPVESLRNE